MNQVQRRTLSELHNHFEAYDFQHAVFRGVSSLNHKLVSTLGRLRLKPDESYEDAERKMLQEFKERAIPFLDFKPGNDWEWLALAQHHGLPTRLLDWTRNPLVAAFFSVQKDSSEPSAIYVLQEERQPLVNIEQQPNPRDVSGSPLRYIPSHVTQRIIVQDGLFTFHPEKPNEPYVSSKIEKIIIPAEYRKRMKRDLYRYGVHQASMFPGLDGLAHHVRWMNEDSH